LDKLGDLAQRGYGEVDGDTAATLQPQLQL